MTENMKTFLEDVSKNNELIERIKSITDKAELIATAKELGFELTEEDFEAPEGELSENELSGVTGGGNAFNIVVDEKLITDYSCSCTSSGCGLVLDDLIPNLITLL